MASRLYGTFEQRQPASGIPTKFVVINASKVYPKEVQDPILTLGLGVALCWSADAQHLAAYHHYVFYENTLLPGVGMAHVRDQHCSHRCYYWQDIVGASYFRPCCSHWSQLSHNRCHNYVARLSGQMETYQTAILACTESALITWIVLLL